MVARQGEGNGWLRPWALSGVIACQLVVDIAAPVLRTRCCGAFDGNDFFATQEQFLIEIRHIIVTHGSDFAFPSSTTYLSLSSDIRN